MNDNNGSNGSGSVRAFKYMKFQNAKVPTRTGYTFNGYFTAKSGGTKVINADGTGVNVWTGTGDTTYYAHWSINSYNLTANANGGTFSSTSGWTQTGSNYYKTINYGTNYSFPEVKRTGYTLDGWYTEASGGSKVTTSTTIGAGSATVYAHWSPIKSTVTLNSQNATTIGTDSVTATYDSAMPAITLPTKTGFTFGGYYTGENGTGTQYYDLSGTSVHKCDFTEATTLYAKWTPNTYHVSLSSQGGTGGDTTVDTKFDQAVPSVTAPTRTGYTFKGYFSELNGKGIKYINEDGSSTGTAWTTASDCTIYAHWEANQYTVTFEKANGTGGFDSATATFDASMPTITIPTYVGYTFEGYFDASTGGEKYYDGEGNSAKSWDKASDTTLYAQWTRDEYSITYENLQGATHTNPTTYNVETSTITFVNPVERAGYTFEGWFDTLNGGNQISSIAKGTTGNITLYAHWKAVDYTITYDNLQGTTHTNPTTYSVETDTFTLTNPTERAGYTFEGWFDAPEGGTQTTTIVKGTRGNQIFYAHWKVVNYTITYENLQGSTQSNPTSYNIESETITLSDPTVRPGHTFVGWFDALDGGNKVTSIAKGSTGNVKVYAHWSDDTSYQPTCSNSLGGWIKDEDGKNKQIVAFGFQFSGEIYPTNDNDFGIIAYRSLASGVEYAKGTVADLIANEGRFYMYLIIDEAEPVTCYARAFVKFNGEYIYSSLVSATGDLTGTEYVL